MRSQTLSRFALAKPSGIKSIYKNPKVNLQAISPTSRGYALHYSSQRRCYKAFWGVHHTGRKIMKMAFGDCPCSFIGDILIRDRYDVRQVCAKQRTNCNCCHDQPWPSMTNPRLVMCWHQKTHSCFLLDLQKEANKCQPENYNIVHNFLKAFIKRSTPPSQHVGRYAIHRPFSFPPRYGCKEIHRLQQQRPKFTGLHCKATCPRQVVESSDPPSATNIALCVYTENIHT